MSAKMDRVIEEAVNLEDVWLSEKRPDTNSKRLTKAVKKLLTAVRNADLLPGEMTFTVRTKDRVSDKTIEAWLRFAAQEHTPEQNLNEVRAKLIKWREWQNDLANSLHMKVPD